MLHYYKLHQRDQKTSLRKPNAGKRNKKLNSYYTTTTTSKSYDHKILLTYNTFKEFLTQFTVVFTLIYTLVQVPWYRTQTAKDIKISSRAYFPQCFLLQSQLYSVHPFHQFTFIKNQEEIERE